MNQIKNRWNDNIICEGEDTIKILAQGNGDNLSEANLYRADLYRANLSWANLEFYKFLSIRLLSSIYLGDISSKLATELMRWDCKHHPAPNAEKLFQAWADGGNCPYQNEELFWRFNQYRKDWKPGRPKMTYPRLAIAICREMGWKIKGYLE